MYGFKLIFLLLKLMDNIIKLIKHEITIKIGILVNPQNIIFLSVLEIVNIITHNNTYLEYLINLPPTKHKTCKTLDG